MAWGPATQTTAGVPGAHCGREPTGGTVAQAVIVERLTDEDARILARERGSVGGHMCKVLIVDGEHDADQVRALVGRRLAEVPRLRDRLVPAPLGIAPPAWVPDDDFALDRHVRDRGRVDDHAALERAVAALMEAHLDRERPLWSMDVLSVGGRRTAIVLRLHHCMADGKMAMRIIQTLLLDPTDDGADSEPRPDRSAGKAADATSPRGAALLGDAVRWRAGWVARRAAEGARTLASRRRSRADATARRERLAAIRRELAPDGQPSPLARRAGTRRRAAFRSFPLDEVKAVAHGAPERATVNDVVLAAMAGGLRRLLDSMGAQAHELRVKVPVSLHRPGERVVANRDSFMFVSLPLDEADPLARLLAIAAETRERKAAHDADALDSFFGDLGRWSRSLERLGQRWAMSPRVFAVNVSNVPGPQGTPTVMGSRLIEMHGLAEIADRHALRVAVVSAADRLSFGLCADADAVQRLDLVADGITRELRALRLALPPRALESRAR
jgi:WS/DGAT/MGAT family acyltransferase